MWWIVWHGRWRHRRANRAGPQSRTPSRALATVANDGPSTPERQMGAGITADPHCTDRLPGRLQPSSDRHGAIMIRRPWARRTSDDLATDPKSRSVREPDDPLTNPTEPAPEGFDPTVRGRVPPERRDQSPSCRLARCAPTRSVRLRPASGRTTMRPRHARSSMVRQSVGNIMISQMFSCFPVRRRLSRDVSRAKRNQPVSVGPIA